MRAYLRQVVASLGYDTAAVADAHAALALLADRAPPTVILTDWNLPGMTGDQLVRALRADPAYAATKILVVTVETEHAQIAAALAAGADEYVMKPFTAEILADKLRILGLPEATP